MSSVSSDRSAQSKPAMLSAGPECRVEDLVGISPECLNGWRELFDRSEHSRVHHHPDYAMRVVGDDSGWVVAAAANELKTLAVFVPKVMKFGRQLLPGARSRIAGIRLAGFGLLGCQDDDLVATIVSTMAHQMCRRRIPVVEFEEIEEDSALWRQVRTLQQKGFRCVPGSAFDTHHRVCLPETADEYWAGFKSKTRYSLRKKRNKLGAYEVKRFTGVSDVEPFLAAAHQVSVNTWQSHQLGLRVKGSDQERRYLEFLAEQGALRSYVLTCETQPVAFVLSHQWKGVYHYDELGFDRRFVDRSPGNILLQEIIDDLLSHDRPDVLDFGLGDADYKQLFGNDVTRTATMRMLAPGIRGWWQSTSMNLRHTLVSSARNVAGRTGIAAGLRRRLRDRAAS